MRTRGATAVKRPLRVVCSATVTTLGAVDAMATEAAAFSVVRTDGAFEIRHYAPRRGPATTPPFTLWFLPRNEIIIPVSAGAD